MRRPRLGENQNEMLGALIRENWDKPRTPNKESGEKTSCRRRNEMFNVGELSDGVKVAREEQRGGADRSMRKMETTVKMALVAAMVSESQIAVELSVKPAI